ncbi:MAG: hypothetical protein EX270_13210 [Pseudomonadales bacterium]|nr:MAG: hypothetical protein EX270_13210 [Pseudomonadales bacterium]
MQKIAAENIAAGLTTNNGMIEKRTAVALLVLKQTRTWLFFNKLMWLMKATTMLQRLLRKCW